MGRLATVLLIVLLGAAVAAAAWSVGYSRWAEARWPADGRMVETRIGPLHIREAGEGAPVILLHGAAANARELLTGLVDVLGEEVRLIALDRPGFGGSPPLAEGPRLQGHADAVAALIEAEGLERPVVVGHSYGGAVALRFALDHPGAASGLVLLGAPSQAYVGPTSWYNYAAAAPVVGRGFSRFVAPIAGPLLLPGAAQAAFAPEAAPEAYAETAGIGLLFRPGNFRANALDLAVVNAELDLQDDRYGEIAAPVAIIAGQADPAVYTHRHSEPLAGQLPDARLALIPDGGHMPHYTAADLVAEHVLALIEARS